MFKNFKLRFTESSCVENPLIEMKNIPFKYKELLLDCGGKSYDDGLYTIHTFKDSLKWTDLLSQYYGKFKDEIISFGHDWMGRQFCVPTQSNECILMFDPATQEDFFIDDNLLNFHNTILYNDKIEFLAQDLFEKALRHLKIVAIDYKKCIGFKIPLFLGGKEEISNYQICDLEVYWDFEYQLFHQVKNVPDGTKVNQVLINPFTE